MTALSRRAFSLMIASAFGAVPEVRAEAKKETDVRLPDGHLRGTHDGTVRSFLGVPYAAPPIGPLRFMPPQRPEPWLGVRDARNFAAAAPQAGNLPQNEDCLYLNIWAPADPGPHPVFVWIHGGSNIRGSTRTPVFDGTNFARHGVVCVTVGYRVGALGFLELGSLLGDAYLGSGNNGLRDQTLALRWVSNNIAQFGGDPARVTLGGESSGAKSVTAQLAAPDSHGLYHQAIIESGGGHTVHRLEDANAVTRLFMSESGTSGQDAQHVLTANVADILNAQARTIGQYDRAFAFRPVIDGRFLFHKPVDSIAAGVSRNIPLLAGTNHDESIFFIPQDSTNTPITPRDLGNIEPALVPSVVQAYEKHFPGDDALQRKLRILSSEEYWIPSLRVMEGHARSGGTCFAYRFDLPATTGSFKGFVSHGAELPYIWDHIQDPMFAPFVGELHAAEALATTLHAAWCNFIHHGHPSAPGLPQWPTYDATRQTMIVNVQSTVTKDPEGEERRLWNGLL